MAIGFSTLQDECGDQGKDWGEVLSSVLPSRRECALSDLI